MATTILNASSTDGTKTGVQVATAPTRIAVRGTFGGARIRIEVSDDDTNYEPLTGPDGKVMIITAPSAFAPSGLAADDYYRVVQENSLSGTTSITVEAI